MEGKSNMKNKLLLQLVSSLLWVPCGLSQFPDLPACLHVIGHRSGLLVSHNLPFSNPEKRKMFSLSQSNSCSLGPHFPSQDESLPSMENIHCLHGNPTPIYKNEIDHLSWRYIYILDTCPLLVSPTYSSGNFIVLGLMLSLNLL